jgi:hypothetical protein
MSYQYEQTLMQLLENLRANILVRPLNLGGVAGAYGGGGGPPGGFVGYLPQTRVAYDSTESAVWTTTASSSLLDNLNHIRYRMNTLEATSGVFGLTVKHDGVTQGTGITVLNITGALNASVAGSVATISGEGSSTPGTTTFLALTDTPSSYAGQHGKYVTVNGTETALEFITTSGVEDWKVKSDSLDPAGDYLYNKLSEGTNISLSTVGNTVRITNTLTNDKVKVTSLDATADYLYNQLTAGSNISITTDNTTVTIANTAPGSSLIVKKDSSIIASGVTIINFTGGVQVTAISGGVTVTISGSSSSDSSLTNPTTVSGVAIWLDATTIVGLSDGDDVTTWSDLSGYGRHATQATAGNKPHYKTNIQNGKPVVRFDGTDDWMSGTPPASPTNFTLVIAANIIDRTGVDDGIFSLGAAGANDWDSVNGVVIQNDSTTATSIRTFRNYGSNVLDMIRAMQSGTQIITFVMGKGVANLYLNGSFVGTDEYSDYDTFSPTTYLLGARWLSGAADPAYAGQIDYMELILYNKKITDYDRQRVEAYLNTRWKIV